MVSRYIQEIPDIYCDTRGRKIFEREVAYAERTISESDDVMSSGRKLYVSPSFWMGNPADDNQAYAFVQGDGRNVWILDRFFTSDLDKRASKFFHEVTHLIDRTPGDNEFEEGGWHKTGLLYEELILSKSYPAIMNRFEMRNVGFINIQRIGMNCRSQWIIRKDGGSMGLNQ